MSKKSIPWARFGFEGALIVISILAAFSIDSWWSARQIEAEEQNMLGHLKLEFETNAALLVVKRNRLEEIEEAAESLLGLTGPDYSDEHVDIEVVEKSINTLKFWSTYDPQMGVLSSLMQSGKLGLISSDHLRNALAEWPARVRDTAENETHLGKFTTESLTPYLAERISARNLDINSSVGPSKFKDYSTSVMTELKFENLIYDKLVYTIDVIEEYDMLSASIDNILQLIADEIDAT